MNPTDAEMPETTPDPVVVFSSNRTELIAIAKSLLMSSEIRFGVMGEEVQDLFGYGRFPTGSSAFIGPVKIVVAAEDEADAREALAGIDADATVEAEMAPDESDDLSGSTTWSLARKAGRVVAALLLALLVLEVVLLVGEQLLGW